MNNDRIRAAIVGCGGIAQVHAESICKAPGVELVACADVRRERADAMAQTYGAAAFDSLEAMLRGAQFDVLHICTPHYLHAGMVELALSMGLSVFAEKPPVISRAQLMRLLSLPGIDKVGICFQNRWNPATKLVQAHLQGGNLGAPLGIRAYVTWARGAEYYTQSGWRGTWATEGGGVLINQSIHTLDLMIQFLGIPTQVRAIMDNFHLDGVIEVEDTVAAYMRFGSAVGSFYATTAYAVDAPVIIEIACERGTLRIDGSDVGVFSGGEWQFTKTEIPKEGEKAYWGNGHVRCIADYYECLRTGAPFASTFTQAIPTIECMLSIYESKA